MPTPRDLQHYEDGFAIFALSVVVSSLIAMTTLLIWQMGTVSEPETVGVAPSEIPLSAN